MCREYFDVVGFDLEPLLQGQTRTAKLKRVYNFSFSQFYSEFSDYVASLSCLSESLLVLGDFNIHCDDSSNAQVRQFLDLLQAHGLQQTVSFATHT